jgi:drug/metabolite transporter (DMT)-like permease
MSKLACPVLVFAKTFCVSHKNMNRLTISNLLIPIMKLSCWKDQELDDEKLGALLVLISAAGFGTLGVLGKLAFIAGLPIPTVLALRFAIGSVVFLLLLGLDHARRRKRRERRCELDSEHFSLCLTARELAVAVGLGALGYAAMSGLFFWGLEFMPVGMVAIVLYTYPVFVVVLSAIVLKEKVTRYTMIALILSFGGVVLITGTDHVHVDPHGVAIILGAAIIYAAYITVSRSVLSTIDARALTAHVLPSAAITFLIYGKITDQLMLPVTAYGWIVVIILAVIATAVPVFAFFAGLSRIGANRASILSTFEPVVTILLGAALLGELLTSITILGGIMVLAGAILVHKA